MGKVRRARAATLDAPKLCLLDDGDLGCGTGLALSGRRACLHPPTLRECLMSRSRRRSGLRTAARPVVARRPRGRPRPAGAACGRNGADAGALHARLALGRPGRPLRGCARQGLLQGRGARRHDRPGLGSREPISRLASGTYDMGSATSTRWCASATRTPAPTSRR
jgi:hypothetical protein